jgi:solute carrier family 13 (sodium-dependent dicarboxylate transporter), member 2/3/5
MSNTAEPAIEKPKMSSDMKHFLFLLLAVAMGAAAYWAPIMTLEVGRRAFAITILMLVMYITETASLAVTSLIGCLLYWVWADIPLNKSFSGFFSDTPWYVLGILLLGVAAESTGLARRLAFNIICRLGNSYGKILAGMMVLNFLLTFIMPSANAKTLILCAISIGMLESFGMAKKSNIGRGLVLAMTYQASMFSVFVIAGAAAILAKGLIESVAKVQVTYGMWFLAFLPIWILTIVASWFLFMKMFPPEKRTLEGGEEYCRAQLAKMGPMSRNELKAVLILGVATLLWVTDQWHHIAAAKIGLAAGLVACLPVIGPLKKEEFAKANFPIVIFIAGAMCMGTVMANTEILKTLTAVLFKWMTPVLQSASITAPVLMYWYNNVFHLFLGNEASLLVATLPALMQFSLKEGFNPLAVGMLWTFASGGKVFLYQMSALATGYSFGCFSTKDLFKIGAAMFFVESFLLLVILPWYWPLIGLAWR